MGELKALREAVIKGDIADAAAETKSALDGGTKPQQILNDGLISAMDEVGGSPRA
jgi:methanogenic corrinoid protein MtbC1